MESGVGVHGLQLLSKVHLFGLWEGGSASLVGLLQKKM